jgi:hypothetical protein
VSDYPGNAWEILSQIRYGLNEQSTALVNGTDTTGSFQNQELMRHANNAQYYLWAILFKQFPEYFLTSASISIAASVVSLPADCFKVRQLTDADGHDIVPMNVGQRHLPSGTGSAHAYYRYGNTLRIDQDSITQTGTLWYYSRCREIDTGMTSAGGALSATLATTAKAIADYYNGLRIENVTDSTNDTITDYSAARVAVVSNTWAASKYYGIVSELPEIFQPLIAARAIITMKQSPRVPVALTKADLDVFKDELRGALQSFAGTFDGDMDLDSLFNDFGA